MEEAVIALVFKSAALVSKEKNLLFCIACLKCLDEQKLGVINGLVFKSATEP
jgi:hypothetical protein